MGLLGYFLVLSDTQRKALVVLFSFVGFLHFFGLLVNLLYGAWAMFFRAGKNLRKYGSWAIVTGATDGIGKGFAKELAKKKINVILISRNQEKLSTVQAELESKYKIQTRTVAVDFASTNNDDLNKSYGEVENLVKELEVGILVNNVGVSYPYAKFVHEIDDELVHALINVNIVALTRLTRIVIPGMLLRKRGAIVNIGSGAATVIPSDPLYAVYAATKAYVDQFSKTLSVEYAAKGISVQCQAPLYVATKLAKIRHASVTCPSPEGYAKSAIKWIGYEARCTPFWAHGVMWGVISRVPVWILDSLRLSQNLAIRTKGIAKEARNKKE